GPSMSHSLRADHIFISQLEPGSRHSEDPGTAYAAAAWSYASTNRLLPVADSRAFSTGSEPPGSSETPARCLIFSGLQVPPRSPPPITRADAPNFSNRMQPGAVAVSNCRPSAFVHHAPADHGHIHRQAEQFGGAQVHGVSRQYDEVGQLVRRDLAGID